MRYATILLLAFVLFLTAISPAFAAPVPGPGFGDHAACMAQDCRDMIEDMHGTFGAHISQLALGAGSCTYNHPDDGGCTCNM